MFLAKPHHDEDFAKNILHRFRQTEAGKLCMTDALIQHVGYRHYCLRRCNESNTDEVCKNVMQEMRELARLFLQFRCIVLYYFYHFSMIKIKINKSWFIAKYNDFVLT